MGIVLMVLILLTAVVLSLYINKLLPFSIPLPLIQIAIGALLSYGFDYEITFEPHLFLLLFIPPLLFLDGWRIPKGAFFKDIKPILMLAIGLVVFTVIGMGYFIHWLLPVIPLAVAFALAAILSPTDPVAVSGITKTSPLPSRLMHLLEGESLLNDATGLVCFSFAVTAVLTGTFSIGSASWSFVKVAGGGVIAGIIVTWLIGRLNRILVKRAGEDPTTQIVISLLIPFLAYLAAEHFHASGILAAAVAGIAMHYVEMSGHRLATTRMQRNAVWNTIQDVLNGIIFILLGDQLPRMIRQMPEVTGSIGVDNPWRLLAYILVITAGLGLLRFAWVWITLRLTLVHAALRGREKKELPNNRLLIITAAAGVRGAITLAGILTLPLLLDDGTAFPARDALIFIAMGVIVLSLLIASSTLPFLTRGLTERLPQPAASGELQARIAIAEAAITRVNELMKVVPNDAKKAAAYTEAGINVLSVYQGRLEYGDYSADQAESAALEEKETRKLRKQAIEAERDELIRLNRSGSIDDDLYQKLLRELDSLDVSLSAV